jgi:acyl-coenzyme A thioesterase PaaI-like protein
MLKTMHTAEPDDALSSAFRRTPFHALTQVEFLSERRVRAPDIPQLKNPYGTVHGGMLFALGEIAAAVAMARLLADDAASLRSITRRASIEYRKPARGAITATSQVAMSHEQITAALRERPSIDVPITVTLADDAGLTVATLAIEWFVGRPKS